MNYYFALQVREDASAEIIEAAYRRLARMHHPDVNASPESESRMKALNEAFYVLSDASRRAEYDRYIRMGQVNRAPEYSRTRPETAEADAPVWIQPHPKVRLSTICRWVAVLPASGLAPLLSSFPLHWVLYTSLQSWIDPYPEFPERLLFPFCAGVSFHWVGAWVAPSHKVPTAFALFGLWMASWGGFLALVLTGYSFGTLQLTLPTGPLGPALSLVGGIIGVYLVWKRVGLSET